MSYRKDPEWLSARADYVSEHPDMPPADALVTRNSAAWRMYRVEMRYEAMA